MQISGVTTIMQSFDSSEISEEDQWWRPQECAMIMVPPEPNQPEPNPPNEASKLLKRAFQKLDLTFIKQILISFDQTDPNIEILTSPDFCIKLEMWKILGPEEKWSDSVHNILKKSHLPKKGQLITERLFELATSITSSLSVVELTASVAKTMFKCFSPGDNLEEDFEPTPIGLFELAVELGDTDLFNLLFEKGACFDPFDWESVSFFDKDSFEEKDAEIIDLALSKGFRMEDLLNADETLEDILENGPPQVRLFLNSKGFTTTDYLMNYGIPPGFRRLEDTFPEMRL